MTQKNKIFSITLSLLILGSVACRKSGGGGPTQTDPIRSLTGNLLIVSTDGTKGANSLPLSFVGASATVSDVKVGQGGDILLFPTNFIIENGNLYLTNLTTTNKDGGEVKAAVSNNVTLTFSLSGENLSRYTDTADIFVGKYSNIYTNTFDTFTNLTTISGDSLKDANNFRQGEFNFGIVDKTFFKDNTFSITNNKPGEANNNIGVNEFISILEKNIKDNKIFTTYFSDVKVSFVKIDEKDLFIATFKVDLTPKSALFDTPYTSYDFIFNALQGKWVQ